MAYRRFASVYDRLMADMPYSRWIEFAEQFWRDFGNQPQHVVDLGCGTGTVSLLLAQAGYHVTGIDLSSEMLAVAAAKSAENPLRVVGTTLSGSLQWLEQDISEWNLPTPVDAVISFCDCFNYLTREDELTRAFEQTFAGLKPGGTFLFDMLSPHQFRTYDKMQPFIMDEDDIAYIWHSSLNEQSLHMEHQLTIFVKDQDERFTRIEETHNQRAYPIEWLERKLTDSGFSKVYRFADFQRKEPTSRSNRIFLAAVK